MRGLWEYLRGRGITDDTAKSNRLVLVDREGSQFSAKGEALISLGLGFSEAYESGAEDFRTIFEKRFAGLQPGQAVLISDFVAVSQYLNAQRGRSFFAKWDESSEAIAEENPIGYAFDKYLLRPFMEKARTFSDPYAMPSDIYSAGKGIALDAGLILVPAAVGGRVGVKGGTLADDGLVLLDNFADDLARAPKSVVPGRVQSRINIAKGQTRFTPLRKSGEPVSAGWEHVAQGHFNRAVTNNRSVFSIFQNEVKALLQSKQVVNSPATAISGGQYVRTVDVGRTIGTSSLNRGGGATSTIKVFTDEAGNLITAYPH